MVTGAPWILAFALSCLFYWPSSTRLMGWGEDPAFNLWNFEFVWGQLSRLGIGALGTTEFWTAPIFGNQPLSLAFSENQIYPALLSWPLRLWTGNGTLTLGLWALISVWLSFVFSWLWLREWNLKASATWGALLFAFSGWFQIQHAHYQHFCVFLFPLALWAGSLFWKRPSWGRICLCGLSWGWVAGWNLYFQVMLNILFFFWVLVAWVRRPELRKPVVAVVLIVGLSELPFFLKYRALEQWAGTLSVTASDFVAFSGKLLSFVARPHSPSLLQKWIPFYPNPQFGVEAAGFVGITWIYILWRARHQTTPLLKWSLRAGCLAYWVSLGPDFGAFYLFKAFPGFGALRAIGRFQFLFMLFSLPVVLSYLETSSRKARWILGVFLCLELLPAQIPDRVEFRDDLFTRVTPFAHFLKEDQPELPIQSLPHADVNFQLSMVSTLTPLWGGYSGRMPPGPALLGHEIFKWVMGGDIRLWEDLNLFAGVRRVAILDDGLAAKAREDLRNRKDVPWTDRGCFEHFGRQVCVFDRRGPSLVPVAFIDLQRDTVWQQADGFPPEARLVAKSAGVLNYAQLAKCRRIQHVRLKGLPEWTSSRSLFVPDFRGVNFAPGDEILEMRSKLIFGGRWSQEHRYSVGCSS